MFTDNAINEAIAAKSAHNLASALAEHGVSVSRSGTLHSSSEACDVAGYGRVFHDSGWVVRSMGGCDDRIDNDELAAELAEVVAMTKQIS